MSNPFSSSKETREPIATAPGKVGREDYEYERAGVADIFMFTEPLSGTRHVSVRERRTAIDWAQEIKALLERYPKADRIRLVCDNLNTHAIGSLYEAFPAEEARRMARKLEIHYTPKHGSWLNIAEIELSALTIQCLDRRIADIRILDTETKAWEKRRNENQKGVNWQFSTEKARIKLHRLYPQV